LSHFSNDLVCNQDSLNEDMPSNRNPLLDLDNMLVDDDQNGNDSLVVLAEQDQNVSSLSQLEINEDIEILTELDISNDNIEILTELDIVSDISSEMNRLNSDDNERKNDCEFDDDVVLSDVLERNELSEKTYTNEEYKVLVEDLVNRVRMKDHKTLKENQIKNEINDDPYNVDHMSAFEIHDNLDDDTIAIDNNKKSNPYKLNLNTILNNNAKD